MRKRYGWDEKRIKNYTRQGRGTGVGSDYKPWLTVADVPSRGRSHRPFCPKTGREHHLLSDGEYFAYLGFLWDDDCIDIREQYPLLDRNETQRICDSLSIRHPVDPHTRVPIVVTTDFLITNRTAAGFPDFAFAVKQAKDLLDLRTVEKLAIEEVYWANRNVAWELLLHEDLKNVKSDNLKWILDPVAFQNDDCDSSFKAFVADNIQRTPDSPISTTCSRIDTQLSLRVGASLRAFRGMLARKEATTDLDIPHIYSRAGKAFVWAK